MLLYGVFFVVIHMQKEEHKVHLGSPSSNLARRSKWRNTGSKIAVKINE